MSFFPDFAVLSSPIGGGNVLAVGWLSAAHPFTTGNVPGPFREKLRSLCAEWSRGIGALSWPVSAGFHACELCLNFRGTGEIGVPAGHRLFKAPTMISHYVDAHAYRPPDEFIDAVMRCPPLDSSEYAESVTVFREAMLEWLRRL